MINWIIWNKTVLTLTHCIAQSAAAVEYTAAMFVLDMTKQSDGDVPLMLELWGMQSTSSMPLLPGPLSSEW